MKAIILAGGSGTRLRPLTCDRPKPMIRVCGRPVLEYSFDLLQKAHIDDATVTLGYLAERISNYYGSTFDGLTLNYTIEETPMGTAGAVRLACGHSDSEAILVLSGDAVCDFDIEKLMAAFHRTGADALLAVKKVEDPREYGLVICGENGRVTGFIEKPSYGQAISELANTGIYILSHRALNLIPEGRPFDFAKDLFPLMLELGMPIYAMRQEGYWCDIGDMASYMRCQGDLLSGRTGCRFTGCEAPAGNYTATGPVFYGHDVQIGEGCRIEGPCVIDDHAVLGDFATVQKGVLLPGAHIGRGAQIKAAIADGRANIGSGAMLFEGSVAGEGCHIAPRAVLQDGVKVWPHKTVAQGDTLTHNIKHGHPFQITFDERGIAGDIGVDLTPELCTKIGAAISTAAGGSLPVAHGGTPACEAICDALSAGMRSTGCDVILLGAVPITVLGYSVGRLECPMGVYIEAGGIKLVTEACLGVDRDTERRIEGALQRDEYLRVEAAHYGRAVAAPIWRELYLEWLLSEGGELTGTEAALVTGDPITGDVLTELSTALQLRAGPHHVTIDLGRDHLSLRTERYTLTHSQTLMLAALADVERGGTVALPAWMPPVCELWAELRGGRIVRYATTPAGKADNYARNLVALQAYQHDPIYAAVRILKLIRSSGKTADELVGELPVFGEAEREIDVSGNPAWIIDKLGGQRLPEGVLIDLGEGSAIVQPSKRGNQLKCFLRAADVALADELCEQLIERIEFHVSGSTV